MGQTAKKVTIKEIAEMAGVHRSTVDKVLHNRPGVSDEVRERISRIIREVDYRPDKLGLALQRRNKTYHLAAVLLEVDAHPFIREGIEQGVREADEYDIQVEYYTTTFQDVDGQAKILAGLIAEKTDGIILSPINSPKICTVLARAEKAGIPVITTNSDIDGGQRLCFVGMDAVRASRIAGRLFGLFLSGAGEIAIVSSSIAEENNSYYLNVRREVFTRFIGEHFPKIKIVECVESLEDPQTTFDKTEELLRRYPALDGIYITCGGVAEVGRAVRQSGRAHELCVFSYEDYPEILALLREEIIDCTLSSDIREQGRLPVKLLMDKLVTGEQPPAGEIFIETRVLVKESVI